ncbi:MAG TPA: AmmeMemoRadiSam system protein A [Anaerolineales bacterium]|nr:AmmeMemoRadiSam system protein A [Anaerolineales bacterium]
MEAASRPGQLDDRLSFEEQVYLLQVAREALDLGVSGETLPSLDLPSIPSRLIEPGATFVTLTKNQELRGCIGSLEATRSLAEDVRVHAVAAALEDYRFPPVQVDELSQISIEISRLTPPKLLKYQHPDELLTRIRPGLDGVVVKKGIRRATFLPQVWDKIPEVEVFLAMLCRKMGAASDCWRGKNVEISTYQVEKFYEKNLPHESD